MQRYALDADLQAHRDAARPQVGPLPHQQPCGGRHPARACSSWAIPTPCTPSARCNKTLPHRGDRLCGPGGYDMKAGIYLALTAARPGRRRLSPLPVDFLVVPDEETGNHASRPHQAFARNARYGLVCEARPPTAASASPRARAPACCAWA